MMKNRLRLLLWLLVIASVSITILLLTNTFALFEDNANAVVNETIGKWVIKLSNNIISDGLSEELEIDNFVYSSNEHVASGYIAPGGNAYFDLVFDATLCDVAVKYDIEFKVDEIDYEDNISISVDELSEGSTIKTAENTYSGVISLDSIRNGQTITLRISLEWDDLEAYDEADTALGEVAGNALRVPINVHAVQYLGETIEPYVPPVDPEVEPEVEP